MDYEDSIYPLEEVILAPVQKIMDDFKYVKDENNKNFLYENYQKKSFMNLNALQFKSIFYYICYYCLI